MQIQWPLESITPEEVKAEHWRLLEKILQLPASQQKHLETIVEGLGLNKTKLQRHAAKNTVMTILGITPPDLLFLRQFKQLPLEQQDDLKRFLQQQLHPENSIESPKPTAAQVSPPKLAPAPIPSVPHSIKVTITPPGAAKPLAPEAPPVRVFSEAELEPAWAAEMPLEEQALTPPESPEAIAESPEAIAESPTEKTKWPESSEVSLTPEHEGSAITKSTNLIQISRLGGSLVISSQQALPELPEALQQILGLNFRYVFGLCKSVDKHAAETVDQAKLHGLIQEGLLWKNIWYPVQWVA